MLLYYLTANLLSTSKVFFLLIFLLDVAYPLSLEFLNYITVYIVDVINFRSRAHILKLIDILPQALYGCYEFDTNS